MRKLTVLAAMMASVLMTGAGTAQEDDPAAYTSDLASLAPLTPANYAVSVETEDGGKAIELFGDRKLLSLATYDVDPAKAYEISIRLRVVLDDVATGGGALTHVGVATFDKNGNELTADPGVYRFAVFYQKLLTTADGWQEFKGIIQGEGNENHKQFRPGTAKVRLVALLNYGSDAAITQLDYLRIKPAVLTPQ